MTRFPNRLVIPIITAILLTGTLAAFAVAWSSSCGSGTNKVCVYRDRDFGLPVAAQNGSNSNYGTAKYPNTNDNINDSASSVKNWYSAQDVIWFHGTSYGGSAFCVDSLYSYSWVGLFSNDAFSSHVVAIDDNSC